MTLAMFKSMGIEDFLTVVIEEARAEGLDIVTRDGITCGVLTICEDGIEYRGSIDLHIVAEALKKAVTWS